MADEDEPYWWPTFDFAAWDTDPRFERALATVQTQCTCTRYEAWMLLLMFMKTHCEIERFERDTTDGREPWEKDD